MRAFVAAWWRAAVQCLHPSVMLIALLPLALVLGVVFLVGRLYWEGAVADIRSAMESWELLTPAFEWLEHVGAPRLRIVLAPMIVVALTVPLVVVGSLLLVAWLAAPLAAAWVAQRRFAGLQRSPQAPGLAGSVAWSLVCAAAALLALALSLPLWMVPPLVLLLPPWIWGWLVYRVLAFAALARHADGAERRQLLRQQRWALRSMGFACGLAALLPSLLWGAGAAPLALAPLLMLLAAALYTLIFVFASLWFAHYLLAALAAMRSSNVSVEATP